MRTIRLIFITVIAGFLIRCSGNYGQDIAGVYVIHWKGEYSIAWDTLIIKAVSERDKIYEVESRAGFQRIKDGQLQPKEFREKKWEAGWDPAKRILSESDFGRQLRILSDQPVLFFGTEAYRKIR